MRINAIIAARNEQVHVGSTRCKLRAAVLGSHTVASIKQLHRWVCWQELYKWAWAACVATWKVMI